MAAVFWIWLLSQGAVINAGAHVYNVTPLFNASNIAWVEEGRHYSEIKVATRLSNGWYRSFLEPAEVRPSHTPIRFTYVTCDYHEQTYIVVDTKRKQIWGIKFINTQGYMYNIFKGTSNQVKGIAIDWITNLIYWTDATYEAIMMTSIEASQTDVEMIIETDLEKPSGIAVHPNEGLLFWTKTGKRPLIERSTLGGRYRSVIISENLWKPLALAIDYYQSLLYWLDADDRSLSTCDLSGKKRRKVYQFTRGGVFGFDIYWDVAIVTSQRSAEIYVVNTTSGASVRKVKLNGTPYGIVACGAWRQTLRQNFCKFRACPGYCVSATGYRPECLCKGSNHEEIFGVNQKCDRKQKAVLLLGKTGGIDYLEQNFADANELGPRRLLRGLYGVNAMDVDANGGYVYFADKFQQVIYRTSIKEKAQTEGILLSMKSVTGLAFDWITRNIYWTDSVLKHIMVARFNGNYPAYVIRGSEATLKAIAVHPIKCFIFWTSIGENSSSIERAKLDGSGRMYIARYPNIRSPVGLAIDMRTSRLFWADSVLETIYWSNFDGSIHTHFYHHKLYGSHIEALTILKNYVVFSDSHYRNIGIYAVNQSGGLSGMTQDDTLTHALAFLDKHNQPKGKNLCSVDNGGCKQLCLPNSKTRVCVCTVGYHKDATGRCDTRWVEDNFLLFADQRLRKIFQMDLWRVELNALLIENLNQPVDVAYDPVDKMVYWTDVGDCTISRAHLKGTSHEILVWNTSFALGELEIDHRSRLLYFVESASGQVGVLSLDTRAYTMLVELELNTTYGLALDPDNGYIYITSLNPVGSLWSYSVSGILKLILNNLRGPTGIYFYNKTVYVAERERIVAVPTTTLKPATVIRAQSPQDVAADYRFVYWTDTQTRAIKRANRFTGGNEQVLEERDLLFQPTGMTIYRKYESEGKDPETVRIQAECEGDGNLVPAKLFLVYRTPRIPNGRLVKSVPGFLVPDRKVLAAECYSGYVMPSHSRSFVCKKGNWSHVPVCFSDRRLRIHGDLKSGYLKFTSSKMFIVPEGIAQIDVICIGGGGGGYDFRCRGCAGHAEDGGASRFGRYLRAGGGKGGNITTGGEGGEGTITNGGRGGSASDLCTSGGAAGQTFGGGNHRNIHGSSFYPFCGAGCGPAPTCPKGQLRQIKGGNSGPRAVARTHYQAGLYGGGGCSSGRAGAGGGGGYSHVTLEVTPWQRIMVTVGKAGEQQSYISGGKGVVVVSWGKYDFKTVSTQTGEPRAS